MALDLNNALANALLDRLDTEIPSTTSVLEIRSGTMPGAENAATGTLLASITLPASAWAAAASGAKAKSGTWQDASADNTGTAAWYRLRDSGDTRRIDGSVTATGGGGDLTLDSTSITATQPVTITSFQYTL